MCRKFDQGLSEKRIVHDEILQSIRILKIQQYWLVHWKHCLDNWNSIFELDSSSEIKIVPFTIWKLLPRLTIGQPLSTYILQDCINCWRLVWTQSVILVSHSTGDWRHRNLLVTFKHCQFSMSLKLASCMGAWVDDILPHWMFERPQ